MPLITVDRVTHADPCGELFVEMTLGGATHRFTPENAQSLAGALLEASQPADSTNLSDEVRND